MVKKGRKFTPLLAHKWERIARVRSRVRRGNSWLKFAKGAKGNDVVQCSASIGPNFEVLATALETCGLKLQSVKALEKEALGWGDSKKPSFHIDPIYMICISHQNTLLFWTTLSERKTMYINIF